MKIEKTKSAFLSLQKKQYAELALPIDINKKIKRIFSMDELISIITQISEQSHLYSLNIKTNPKKYFSGLSISSFQLSGACSFSQCMRFYYLLLQSPLFLNMDDWEWKKSENNRLTINATIEIYNFK